MIVIVLIMSFSSDSALPVMGGRESMGALIEKDTYVIGL
jgi:hypothetical protein